ncbi:MAG: ABC transporter permease [Campylobacteraceae bacterium]|jgi:D-methionine transport system permease protein|nr:ABC transporter permease [Campylobacteraceae bacterium]
MDSILSLITDDLSTAFWETFQMVGISFFLAIVLGIPLGLFLFITDKGLFFENKILHTVSGFLINVIRSIPYIILMVLLLPLSQALIGTTIGPIAASISLSVAAIAFYARLVESSLCEVDKGVIEAAEAYGATPLQIIKNVLLAEALPGLIRGLTVTGISLIGYSAMAGIIGGGGVGDLAIRFGYYRYETNVMIITVVALIILVQIVQMAGDILAAKADRK